MKKRILICIGVIICALALYIFYVMIRFPNVFVDYSKYYSWVDFIPAQWDPYSDLRPQNCVPSKWLCENPNISFDVSDGSWMDIPGQLIMNNEKINVKVSFNRGKNIYIFDENGNGFAGYCKFYKDYFIVFIDSEERLRDSLFEGKYEELVFRKASVQ